MSGIFRPGLRPDIVVMRLLYGLVVFFLAGPIAGIAAALIIESVITLRIPDWRSVLAVPAAVMWLPLLILVGWNWSLATGLPVAIVLATIRPAVVGYAIAGMLGTLNVLWTLPWIWEVEPQTPRAIVVANVVEFAVLGAIAAIVSAWLAKLWAARAERRAALMGWSE